MQIVTSWMEQGIEQGKTLATQSLVLRLLQHRVGVVPEPLEARVKGLLLAELETLGEALLFGSEPLEARVKGLQPFR